MRQVFETAPDTVGLAWGRVLHGELVECGGVGDVSLGSGILPDEHTQFRIASMTKSFTAAAVMVLRDRGRLRLDDEVGTHVPEVRNLVGPTTDSGPITLRRLLSMGSGLPTDDPWADRLLDADHSTMDELFTGEAHFAVAPDDEFVYSNYGYAMLGRVISEVSGQAFGAFIADELLSPLDMARTSWQALDDGGAVASPHRFRDGSAIAELEPLGHGGFASMGGLWSTVADLGRWVAWFCDAYPARDGDDLGPLCRASRREMCTPSRTTPATATVTSDASGATSVRTVAGGYGYGVIAVEDSTLGLMVSHSGGLPGYGSNMRWLPRRGVGVIALANATYAPMQDLTLQALNTASNSGDLPPAPERSVGTTADELCRRLVGLLNEWSDDEAEELFAFNVELDDGWSHRRSAAEQLRSALGSLEIVEVTARHAARTVLSLAGSDGQTRRLVVDLTPTHPLLIQSYKIQR